jgi:glycosyltransferase involved in cell wall biosynthesis
MSNSIPKNSTIGIDCRFARFQAGIASYTRQLVEAITMLNTDTTIVLFVFNKKEAWIKNIHNVKIVEFPVKHYSLAEQLKFPSFIKKSKVDLMLFTQFNVPMRCPVPYVVTVHDLTLHTHPGDVSLLKKAGYRFLMKYAVTNAKQVIAVSNFTKSELQKFYGEAIATKTVVIHHGIHHSFTPQPQKVINRAKEKYRLKKPYILYVGGSKVHKNIPFLIDVFTESNIREELVLVSGGPGVESLTLPKNVKWLQNVPDEDLPGLYSGARCFVTASLLEGFGLIIAEAESCNCPVIAMMGSSIDEVASDEAVLLPPQKQHWLKALKQLPPRPLQRPVWLWQTAAKKTMDVLTSAFS